MSKIGLVLEGGGMKCAYTAGILDAMMDNGVTFDYCIGVSAGSANGVSFVAGQRGRNIRFYTEHINEKGYFGLSSFLKTGNLFGLQYIYGTLTNSGGADPLDFDAFMKSPMEYWLVATDAQTGKPTYFSKKDNPTHRHRSKIFHRFLQPAGLLRSMEDFTTMAVCRILFLFRKPWMTAVTSWLSF